MESLARKKKEKETVIFLDHFFLKETSFSVRPIHTYIHKWLESLTEILVMQWYLARIF